MGNKTLDFTLDLMDDGRYFIKFDDGRIEFLGDHEGIIKFLFRRLVHSEQLVNEAVENTYKKMGYLSPKDAERIKGKSVENLSVEELESLDKEFEDKHLKGFWRKSYKESQMEVINGSWYFKGFNMVSVSRQIKKLKS